MQSENSTSTVNNDIKPVRAKQENPWLSLGFNIFIPAILMSKGDDWFGFSPAMVLSIALLFPISYGIYDFIQRKKYNLISILGFTSVLLTGGIGLLELDKDWIAVKEAAIPGILGVATLVTLKTSKPLVRLFLYNDQIINVPKVEAQLEKNNSKSKFDRLLVYCTFLLACSFTLSAVLNYFLAKHFIRSDTGTDAFNDEMAKMTFWSYPVIFLPTMVITVYALWKMFKGIKLYTGLEIEDIFILPEDVVIEKKESK